VPHLDIVDAGVYVYKFVAAVPKSLRVVLWGPLQARELGFLGWTYQDGGETGFLYHSDARGVKMGTCVATLTYVRRMERAFLTMYLAGYPSDAPREQRLIDVRSLVTEAELFLSKMAAEPIRFELASEQALVDNQPARPTATPTYGKRLETRAPKPRADVTWEV
jgi:hypothetical protein